MNRTALAFLIAPLWVPAATAFYGVYLFPKPKQGHWIFFTTVVGAVFAYGGVLLLGTPAFLILRAHKLTAFWIAPVLGFFVGVITCSVFLVFLGLSLGNSLPFSLHELAANPVSWSSGFFPTGALGAIVGATLWLIARPNRNG
jgi:hypothetical protein